MLSSYSLRVVLVAAAWLVIVCVALASKATAQPSQRTRTIFFDTFPIADKLRPEDEVVAVETRADEVVTDEVLSGFEALQVAALRRTAEVERTEFHIDGGETR